jgi:hypothetical protein
MILYQKLYQLSLLPILFLNLFGDSRMNRAKKIVDAILTVSLVLLGVSSAYEYYGSARVYGYNSPYGTSGSHGYWSDGYGYKGGFGRGML